MYWVYNFGSDMYKIIRLWKKLEDGDRNMYKDKI